MLALEAHHRRQVIMLAHQPGYRLPDEAAFGIWHWNKVVETVWLRQSSEVKLDSPTRFCSNLHCPKNGPNWLCFVRFRDAPLCFQQLGDFVCTKKDVSDAPILSFRIWVLASGFGCCA